MYLCDRDMRGQCEGRSNDIELHVDVLRSVHRPVNELCERSIMI